MNVPSPLELATAQNRIGEELGVSPWVAIDQVKVNVFGEVTHWRTPGHCDPEYAETTPYGGTLMHGFHVLACYRTSSSQQASGQSTLATPSITDSIKFESLNPSSSAKAFGSDLEFI